MTISGTTRVYAILGDPLVTVRSPEHFNGVFAERGIDAVMIPAEVKPADFSAAVNGFKRLRNCHGLILTMPHKQAMCEHVDELRDNGRLCGAVNAVRRMEDGSWIGDMFDGRGYLGALARHQVDPAGKRVHMIGAGGVARAMAMALAAAGIASITLRDVDANRARDLANALGAAFPGVPAQAVAEDRYDADIIVNATPLGIHPGQKLPCDPSRLASTTVVSDVIPKPEITPLVAAAHERGCTVTTGRDMFQAQVGLVAHFFGWTDRP